ncbi:3308_t:CDS:2 [Entrophospora sp. SA101]|nr:3308_t:CDS:2 [Entrophospora sp. SA101]
MPGSPGFSYFLGTPCKEWDSYMYHEAWKNAGLSMNKNTLMRAFNKQVELIKGKWDSSTAFDRSIHLTTNIFIHIFNKINTTLKACSTVNYRPSMPLLASIYDESPAFIGGYIFILLAQE